MELRRVGNQDGAPGVEDYVAAGRTDCGAPLSSAHDDRVGTVRSGRLKDALCRVADDQATGGGDPPPTRETGPRLQPPDGGVVRASA